MFVKPNQGRKVRDPDTKGFLPEEGAQVPPSLYWTRRLRDKDVVECEPPSATPDTPAPTPTEAHAEEEAGK